MTFTKYELIGYAIGDLICVAGMMLACLGLYKQAMKYQKLSKEYKALLEANGINVENTTNAAD